MNFDYFCSFYYLAYSYFSYSIFLNVFSNTYPAITGIWKWREAWTIGALYLDWLNIDSENLEYSDGVSLD